MPQEKGIISDYSEWVPKDYLKQYYSTTSIAEDEQTIYRFILRFLREQAGHFEEMLEFGTGPTIHHLIPFAPYVEKIFVADYLKSNLREIESWVENKGDAYDWSTYINGVLNMENSESDTGVNRSNLIRSKIVRLLKCDIFQEFPLGEGREFPLVTSFYCAECATDSRERWLEAMKNLFSLVAPGGWLIISALRDTDKYKVGEKYFPTVRINENDVREVLAKSGFINSRIEAHKVDMWLSEGFNGIIIASAMKQKKV